jgi:hypothetical protein
VFEQSPVTVGEQALGWRAERQVYFASHYTGATP